MEILCIHCLHKGKRRSRDSGVLFPCNHVFCAEHGKSHTSCPHCGARGEGKLVDFARLARVPNRAISLLAAPLTDVFQTARRALAFWEVNSRTQAELVACHFAYKSLLADKSREASESAATIAALKQRLSVRPPPGTPVPSPMRAPPSSGVLGSLLLLPQKRPNDHSDIDLYCYKARR